jgi:hypothetical protein
MYLCRAQDKTMEGIELQTIANDTGGVHRVGLMT